LKLIDGVIAERAGDHPPGGELMDALAMSVLLRSLSVLAELRVVEVDAPSQVDEIPRKATATCRRTYCREATGRQCGFGVTSWKGRG